VVRERFALTSLFIAALLAVGLVGWQPAIVTLLGTYVVMFLSRYAFPGPAHPYYLKQVIDDVRTRLRIADHFKDGKRAAHLRTQLEIFEGQLPERLADAANKHAFWQRQCAHPLIISFSTMREGLSASERNIVDNKAIEIRQVCQDVVTGSGPARAECERRRMSALVLQNYQAELQGDFSNSTPKAKETVLTLLASGLAYELLLGESHPAVLNEVFPEDERSPLNT
jgi:hypothetical protein